MRQIKTIVGFFIVWIVLFAVLFAGVVFVGNLAGVDYLVSEDVNDPIRISIPKIGIDSIVQNPTTNDIPTLDAALKEGAVRHPDSSRLGERGRMFIFGHSSALPIVQNQNYRAFNGLGNLVAGDRIFIRSSEAEYEYVVDRVRLVDANEEYITLDKRGYTITLSTCNSFGTRQERFVVEGHRLYYD